MSHDNIEPGRSVLYRMPVRPSDRLRALRFAQFFEGWHGAAFAVRTADGWTWCSSDFHQPVFSATFRSRDGLDAVIGDVHGVKLASIFLNGDLEIQGDIFALLAVLEFTLHHSDGLNSNLIRTISRLRPHIARRFRTGRRKTSHSNWGYAPCPLDLPVAFFESWLGPVLLHSCAMNPVSEDRFESAQRDALERACASLELERGDRLLDVGCGWGSLLLHAAQRYGIHGRGIPATDRQAEAVTDRLSQTTQDCTVECRNLRNAPYRPESFDKIAHIGIFEQVVSSGLHSYLETMKSMLVPGGQLLLHRMTRGASAIAPVTAFHPELFSVPLSRELEIAEMAGLEIVKVESLQQDYEQTLRIWIDHLRRSTREVASSRDYRTWLLYLVEIAASLHSGDLQVHRILLRRPVSQSATVRPASQVVSVPPRSRKQFFDLRSPRIQKCKLICPVTVRGVT